MRLCTFFSTIKIGLREILEVGRCYSENLQDKAKYRLNCFKDSKLMEKKE